MEDRQAFVFLLASRKADVPDVMGGKSESKKGRARIKIWTLEKVAIEHLWNKSSSLSGQLPESRNVILASLGMVS